MKAHYVVGLGEILWDMLPSGKKLGGAPANFAYHASGFGLDGIALSAIGRDALGREIEEALSGAGVPEYNIVEGVAWDGLEFDADFARIASESSCVCFGTLAQRSPASRKCIQAFLDAMPQDSLKVYDINLRQNYYSEDLIRESVAKSDILKLNDDELVTVAAMFGCADLSPVDACRRLLADGGLRIVILTCGTAGSYVITSDRELFRETPVVDVIDTVGAGDSFTAAFCAALLKGHDLETAHEAAVRVSAFVCTRNGAMPELPEELKALV